MAKNKLTRWLSDEGLNQLRLWATQGMSLPEIADHAEVHPATLQRWQKAHPELAAALQISKPAPAEGETKPSAAASNDTTPPPESPCILQSFPGESCLPMPEGLPGDEAMDMLVQNALLRRAVGFQYDEYTYAPKTDPLTGETVLAPAKRTTKTVLPDISAQIYWLKNRLPAIWRDKPAETAGEQTVQVFFDTDEEADEE